MLMSSSDIDGAIIHGWGQFGFDSHPSKRLRLSLPQEDEESLLREVNKLISKYNKPILSCSFFTPYESKTIKNLVTNGIRVYHNVGMAATILANLYIYYSRIAMG
jgi:acyl-CoA synthetase (NDP forming)